MGQMKKLGAVAPLKKRSYKERIAASSAKLAEIWKEFEDSERVLEAFSRSQGYTCPIGPFEGALPPFPAPGAPVVDVEASLSELETAVAEAQRAYKHTSQRLELVCRSYGLPSPFGPSSRP
ncbi:unnamed protein product [Linum tenue]|uniref:Uncharacterized protein n=2 Tax=Linum TaxID=4005 RepID=A0AAV0N8A3_9ROSI|nr:unnamed protein product [Linum tenue]